MVVGLDPSEPDSDYKTESNEQKCSMEIHKRVYGNEEFESLRVEEMETIHCHMPVRFATATQHAHVPNKSVAPHE